jgi:hypothetical protein
VASVVTTVVTRLDLVLTTVVVTGFCTIVAVVVTWLDVVPSVVTRFDLVLAAVVITGLDLVLTSLVVTRFRLVLAALLSERVAVMALFSRAVLGISAVSGSASRRFGERLVRGLHSESADTDASSGDGSDGCGPCDRGDELHDKAFLLGARPRSSARVGAQQKWPMVVRPHEVTG